jgi:hypothetical protein
MILSFICLSEKYLASTYVVKDKFSQTSHRRQTTFRILHSDIKAIICFVPIANSPTEWRTVSLPINIRESSHTLSPHYPYPTHSSSSPDHISNRIPYSPEPYSTNRPKILSYPHNTGDVDPTPNVDIGDILDKKPHPPMIHIDSLSANSHMMERDYLYGGNPPRGNVHFPSTTPPPPQPQYSHQYRGSEQPDIITLDNIHHFNPHIPPVHSDIHEANMRHRQRFQMSKTTTTSTTTPPPPPTPFYDHPKYSHDFHHQHQHHAQVPEHFPEREREQWQDYGPREPSVKHNKEYKVSSQLNFNTKHKGYVESAGDKYLPAYTTTPTPPRFSPDQESREETPKRHQQQRPSPMIHYDSKEKQYGLKDNTNNWKTMKAPAPYDEHIPSSSYYQTTPPSPSPPQYWDERKKTERGGSVVLEPDVPIKLDSSIPYAPNDYYISSLIAKHRQKQSEEESKVPTPLYPDASMEQVKSSESMMLHHRHHEQPSRPPPPPSHNPTRYGERQDGWERVHTQMGVSNHYNDQINLRRSGYHSVSGEFVELG